MHANGLERSTSIYIYILIEQSKVRGGYVIFGKPILLLLLLLSLLYH